MNNQVTISKREYRRLLDRAFRFEHLKQLLQEDIFSLPPTRDTKEIIKEFQETGKYTKKFIDSLARGLRRSSYFK
ncbi:MAG: hypothetical protein COU42_00885 [Candidatus Nealsonbacteria bacterium CG10_big_fil_rev_8_21_14_0_10_36_24]|uniref:Uncharacterized protein n=1 Tax=Candidatus Nealsonbacteria bacterium CG10_big_fil_rev_8_21_14_0_10_36_24 TaxID=1974710 RepID=A0A2M6NSG6_9BACT|nr:MAG: hypothetical protein COU42_00885 [Candidatus Nealsonbacteria bacterium CG10_big_fil_rev_8_21_14_0_10_36_24]